MTLGPTLRRAGIDPASSRLKVLAETLLRHARLNRFGACDSLMDAARRDNALLRALALHYLGEIEAEIRGVVLPQPSPTEDR